MVCTMRPRPTCAPLTPLVREYTGTFCAYVFHGDASKHAALEHLRRLVGPGVIDGRSWSCGEQLPIDDPEGVTTSSPRSRPSPFRRLERLVRCLLVVVGPLLCAAVAITWAL